MTTSSEPTTIMRSALSAMFRSRSSVQSRSCHSASEPWQTEQYIKRNR